jgi:hypothetical protein
VITTPEIKNHEKHDRTSQFTKMHEATPEVFKKLCAQYDRLNPDGNSIILMKIDKNILNAFTNPEPPSPTP